MASGGERPDLQAFEELEQVLRLLEGELAAWRRRALQAEARTAELEARGDGAAAAAVAQENQALHQRLEAARSRVSDLLSRLEFLEQQRGNGEG
jgi:predicted  nucleic acid-binding Zn-ribbon protein